MHRLEISRVSFLVPYFPLKYPCSKENPMNLFKFTSAVGFLSLFEPCRLAWLGLASIRFATIQSSLHFFLTLLFYLSISIPPKKRKPQYMCSVGIMALLLLTIAIFLSFIITRSHYSLSVHSDVQREWLREHTHK